MVIFPCESGLRKKSSIQKFRLKEWGERESSFLHVNSETLSPARPFLLLHCQFNEPINSLMCLSQFELGEYHLKLICFVLRQQKTGFGDFN